MQATPHLSSYDPTALVMIKPRNIKELHIHHCSMAS